MLQTYPVVLIEDENLTIIARFPDVPEAVTLGADASAALERTQDALVVALSGYPTTTEVSPVRRLSFISHGGQRQAAAV